METFGSRQQALETREFTFVQTQLTEDVENHQSAFLRGAAVAQIARISGSGWEILSQKSLDQINRKTFLRSLF